jgi:hypothetical protein
MLDQMASIFRTRPDLRQPSGLQVRDTAECNSALQEEVAGNCGKFPTFFSLANLPIRNDRIAKLVCLVGSNSEPDFRAISHYRSSALSPRTGRFPTLGMEGFEWGGLPMKSLFLIVLTAGALVGCHDNRDRSQGSTFDSKQRDAESVVNQTNGVHGTNVSIGNEGYAGSKKPATGEPPATGNR